MTTAPIQHIGKPRLRGRAREVPIRHTVITAGRLAWQAQRLEAARAGATGRQVTTIDGLACRLAGGFTRPIDRDTLRRTIEAVVPTLDLGALERIKALPGFVDAALETLRKAWSASYDLASYAAAAPRIAEVARLEAAVLAALPAGAMRPVDIAAAAVRRMRHASAVSGPVRFVGVVNLPPCWRALVVDLADHVPVTWSAPAGLVPAWLPPEVARETMPERTPDVSVVSAATARHEAVEAMRWVRALLARGVDAGAIAIAAVAPADYDDHVAALAADASLPVHFAQGVPVVATRDGQAAAALAELLVRGLSQNGVRRLAALALDAFAALPEGWQMVLPRQLALTSPANWRAALALAEGAAPWRDRLGAIVDTLAAGPGGADAAADLLTGRARTIFARALAAGPAASLDLTLATLRLPDGVEPSVSVVFAPAGSLAAAPRAHVRLLGLNSSRWPRQSGEDRLLSDHVVGGSELVVGRKALDPVPLTEADRNDFETIARTTTTELVLSHARRGPDGRRLGRSVLLPPGEPVHLLSTRAPDHAFSESDRLAGRADDFAATAQAAAATACWRDWARPDITAHDGAVRAGHPAVAAALARTQSASSFRLLMRNPLGFVHKYALGLKAPDVEAKDLTLDPMRFGNLVHAVLERLVAAPGDLAGAVAAVAADWERAGGVPPPVVWQRTLGEAAAMAAVCGTIAPPSTGARSYAEVPFGGEAPLGDAAAPWPADAVVAIPGTPFRIKGRIDRVDIAPDGGVHVWDYKTGKAFGDDEVLRGGRELQRCIYAYAVRAMRGDVAVTPALVFPRAQAVRTLADPDATLGLLAGHLAAAAEAIAARGGTIGAATGDRFDDLAFALPASATYTARKRPAATDWLGSAAAVWEEK